MKHLLLTALTAGATFLLASATLVENASGAATDEQRHVIFDDTYQFIYFATLEGLYRDGASNDDVKALLATDSRGNYVNFIYTCPVCMPVESAILTYKDRAQIDRLKTFSYQNSQRTFGFGFPDDIAAGLRSTKAGERLKAVNTLVSQWIAFRMDHSGLTDAQKKDLIDNLKARRDKGNKVLTGLGAVCGYKAGDECAICNGALQMPLKFKGE